MDIFYKLLRSHLLYHRVLKTYGENHEKKNVTSTKKKHVNKMMMGNGMSHSTFVMDITELFVAAERKKHWVSIT